MFSEIDKIIFSDSCEVVEVIPSQLYVFPIFKNGSTSIRHLRNKWKSLNASDLKDSSIPITVFVRNPRERFISGVNTYLQHIKRQHSDLDEHTILWFVDNYLFLNRHFCPQFFWLLNLASHVGSDVKFKLSDVSEIKNLTSICDDATIIPPSDSFLESIAKFNWERLELYMFLDQILLDRIGQELTMTELLNILKHQYSDLYQLIFNKTYQLFNVLPET